MSGRNSGDSRVLSTTPYTESRTWARHERSQTATQWTAIVKTKNGFVELGSQLMNKARREGVNHMLLQVRAFDKMAMEEGNGMSSYVHSSSLVGPRPAGEGYTFWTSQSLIRHLIEACSAQVSLLYWLQPGLSQACCHGRIGRGCFILLFLSG